MKISRQLQRRRAPKSGPSISLFPFLAVLICTMGALVPLLLAVSRTARLQAEAVAQAKAAETTAKFAAEAKTQQEDAKWRVAQLKESRHRTESQLTDARLELGHFEDHARRLRDQIARCQAAVADLDRMEKSDGQEVVRGEVELQELRGQVEVAKKQLDETSRSVTSRPRSYAVVPYEGPNQTRRRPVYIECRADAVVLQPEGIKLTDADFEGPLAPGNPLAAALRAAREYLRDDLNAGEPYPMLLVRPDGIVAYYAARAAMKSWGGDFGYELIGDDWKLAYQSPDPKLADIYRQVIATGRISEARLAAAAPRQYGRPRTGRATSRGDGEEFAGGGEPGRVGGGDGGGGGGVPAGQGTAGGNIAASGGVAGGSGAGTASYGGSGGPAISGTGSGPALGAPASGAGSGFGSVADGTGGSSGSSAGGWAEGTPGNPCRSTSDGLATGGFGGGSAATGSVGDPEAAITGASASGKQTAVAGLRSYGGTQAATGGAYGSRVGNTPGVAQGNGGIAGQAGSSAAAERPEGYVVGRPAHEQNPDPQRDRESSDGVVHSQPLRPGEWEPTPDLPDRPEKKDDFADRKGKRDKPTIDRRGEDWALRNAGRNSVAIARPIRVECYADRLVVISDRGPINNRIVKLGPRTDSSIDTLISAIWEQMEGWGMAGRGMYWRPVLQISVAPDAQQRFGDLSRLLDGSGMTVERR